MFTAPGSTGYIPPHALSRERNSSPAPAQQEAARAEPVASELECDPDAQERADLITKCLAAGLSDDQIEGVLREHMFQKMVEQEQMERAAAPPMAAAAAVAAEAPAPCSYQPRNSAQAPAASSVASRLIAKSHEQLAPEYKAELETASKQAQPPECTFQAPKHSSVAAKRKARAESKSVSFGPSDEEIVGIIEAHTSGPTPSPCINEQKGSGGAPNIQRSAYMENKRLASEAKTKSRNGSIIF